MSLDSNGPTACSDPGYRFKAVTPHATNKIEGDTKTRALFVGTGGDVEVISPDTDAAIVFKNVADGQILPLRVTRVLAANTTATDIVALF